jgi:aminopeptidase N
MNRLHARCQCFHEADGGTGRVLSANASAEHAQLGEPLRGFALATSSRHYERARPFRIDALTLDWELLIDEQSLVGSALLAVSRVGLVEYLELDAIAFDIQNVKVDGRAVAFTYDGAKLQVPIPKSKMRAEVLVAYRVKPRRGLYFLAPDDHVPARPRQVWTQCQEEDARHFIPCHDKPHTKMPTSLRVVVPPGFYALSNGALVTQDHVGGKPRFHWKLAEPQASYLITLVVGQFDIVQTKAGKLPLSYLVPPGRKADVARTFQNTPAMVAYFGERFGVAYPWNKYAQVVVSDFIFGGMENTTATTLYEHVLLDERASLDITSDDLIAHELAHQWFGDLVTCRDWSEGWLNEGFATFAEHLWREHSEGRDAYEYGLLTDLESYLGEAQGRYRRPVVCQDYDVPLDLFDRHLYEKGGLVLHSLRHLLGDTAFFAGVTHYLKAHAHSVVETRDLARAFEDTAGVALGQLVDELLYKPGHPELAIELTWADGVLQVHVKQTQRAEIGVPAVFHVGLDVQVVEAGRPRLIRLEVGKRQETFSVLAAKRPDFVVMDPSACVLGSIQTKAPNDWLRAQLRSAPSARGRWLAAHALRLADDELSINALSAALADAKQFWGTRCEVAAVLGQLRCAAAERALLAQVTTRHPKVRRAIAQALGAYTSDATAAALDKLALTDASYLVVAAAARALGKTKHSRAFDTLVSLLTRPSWADVVCAGALDGLAASNDPRATAHLEAYCKYGKPTRARRAAISGLAKVLPEARALDLFEELLPDADPHLRIDVVRALVQASPSKARRVLVRQLERDLDPRVRRRIRESLRDLSSADPKAEVTAVRDELDKLQRDHTALKTQVAALEARARGPKVASKSQR